MLISKEQQAIRPPDPLVLQYEVELFRTMGEEGVAIYKLFQRAFYQKKAENPLDSKSFYKVGCAAALVNWTEVYLHTLEVRSLVREGNSSTTRADSTRADSLSHRFLPSRLSPLFVILAWVHTSQC